MGGDVERGKHPMLEQRVYQFDISAVDGDAHVIAEFVLDGMTAMAAMAADIVQMTTREPERVEEWLLFDRAVRAHDGDDPYGTLRADRSLMVRMGGERTHTATLLLAGILIAVTREADMRFLAAEENGGAVRR